MKSKAERKNILLLCDDIRMQSGVATMAREIVIHTAHEYNWFNVAAAANHPEAGKILDVSNSVNSDTGLTDSSVQILPWNGYGNPDLLRSLIKDFHFDAIFIFTDPRYWDWLFDMEREIRSKMPIFYLSIWDEYPVPYYNKSYYKSCDVHMCISKQTKNITKILLPEIVDLDKNYAGS